MKQLNKNFGIFLLLLFALEMNAQTFTDSNLPIISINTFFQQIPSEPKVTVAITIYYHPNGSRNYLTDTPYFTGFIGIETRGSSSSSFAKQSYGFETLDNSGLEADTSFFNFPKESDWILFASHSDKSFLRTTLTYNLYQNMGRYAARSQHCELLIDGQYQGIYILLEKIKRDNNRVDIAKLTANDTAGVDLTGGYIFKQDNATGGNGADGFQSFYINNALGWSSYFFYEYPSDSNLLPVQKQYLTSFVDSAEYHVYNVSPYNATSTYRDYFDIYSMIDYMLIEEISRNPDGYARSTFIVKPKDNVMDKLQMGPPWDFDIAWRNSTWCDGGFANGFYYNDTQTNRLTWFDKMMADSIFRNEAKCRWEYLRQNIFTTAYIHNYIDSMAAYLNEGQQRNYQLWPSLSNYVFLNIPPYPQTYQEEIDSLKSYVTRRIAWIDAHLPGTCNASGTPDASSELISLSVYPNPSESDYMLQFISSKDQQLQLTITDLAGREVMPSQKLNAKYGNNEMKITMPENFPPGLYLATLKSESFSKTIRLIRK